MADSDADFTHYAGRVSFPRTPEDLTNTSICPACLSPLTSRVCTVCTLDLNHPAAAELFQTSTDAATALRRRLALIGRIRFETAQLIEQQAAARGAQATASASSVAASSVAAAPRVSAAVATPPVAPAVIPPVAPAPSGSGVAPLATPTTAPGAPRRSSVQLVMLVVGVSLLSIAAIFFLVFAFITYGLLVRSLIIGGITIAAIVTASLLRSRRLHSTAEGIAVFAAILVYLDAFAVRANDLAGLGSAEGAIYWGAALVASAVALVLWHRASGLRVPNVVGFTALAPGLGLLVGGLADGLDTPGRYFAAFGAAALAGLAHPIARARGAVVARRMEPVVLLALSSAALVCGFFTAFAVQPQSEWGGAIALIVLALIAFAHVAVTARFTADHRAAGVFAAVSAGVGGVALASSAATVTLRSGDLESVLFWPIVVASVITLGLEAIARRAAGSASSPAAITAAVAAAAVTAFGIVISAGFALVVPLSAAGSAIASPWSAAATSVLVERTTFLELALAGLALVLALVTAAWATAALARRRGAILLWSFAVLLVVATPLLETLWVVVAAWLLLAVATLVVLVAVRPGSVLRGSERLPMAVAGIASTALAYATSWLSVDVWGWVTLVTIALLLGARLAAGAARPAPRAVLLGIAAVVGLVGAAALARQWGGETNGQTSINELRFVGILATVLLAAAAVPARSDSRTRVLFTAIDRRTVFWLAAPTALITFGITANSVGAGRTAPTGLLLPEYGTSLVLALALLGALLAWAIGARATELPMERALASLAIAPVTYWVVDSFARVAHLPQDTRLATPIVASLLVAVGSLVAAVRQRPASPRWLREIGLVIVAVPGVLLPVLRGDQSAWFVLLIAAVTTLILSIDTDGLFASVSPRRHLGWLAIVLATAGLWWRLGSQQVTAVEAYVLPVAGVLFVVAALIWRSARRRARVSSVSPLVFLGGLLVAILPLAADASSGPVARAYLVAGLSSLLLLAAVFAKRRGDLDRYLAAAALAGALGVVITTVGRSYFLVTAPGTADARLESWIGGCAIVLVAAAFGLERGGGADEGTRTRWRALVSRTLVVVAMTVVLAFEAASLTATGPGLARAFVTLVLFLAIYLIAALWTRAPFTRVIGWTGLGYGAAVAVLAIATGAIDPLEFATVPVALALIADGAVRLAERPQLRSWPALGTGVAVLLLPSLLATADERPLWRLVGLGLVAVAVLIVGAVRRLQAPFVLGAVVALIHGIATFSTEIRIVYESLPWWLWLGIGGVLLIAIAARYERRIKNLRDVAMRVAALR
jgi:hypothetical protein